MAQEVGTFDVRGNIGVGGGIRVTMERTDARRTPDEALWSAIDETCRAIGFEQYLAHIGRIFELGPFQGEISRKLRELGARGVGEIGITGVGAAVANAVFNAQASACATCRSRSTS